MQWSYISWPRRWRSSPPGEPLFRVMGLALMVALTQAACSGGTERELGEAAHDRYPDPADIPPGIALIPEAEPRHEPVSRYGNPPEYEVFGQRYRTLPTSNGFEEEGLASWYGTRFHGERTSSGEPYDMYAMTAAHKSLPLPSYVEVTNLENDKKVVVRINDRGPFVEGRIIDLSYAAAHRIDMTDAGVARVRIRALVAGEEKQARVAGDGNGSLPGTDSSGETGMRKGVKRETSGSPEVHSNGASSGSGGYVQVGAYAARDSAEQVRHELSALGFSTVGISELEREEAPRLYRVRIGPLDNGAAVREVTERLRAANRPDYRVVREQPSVEH